MLHVSFPEVLEGNNSAAQLTSPPILIKQIINYGSFTWEINAE
jgi:hypothetical protein